MFFSSSVITVMHGPTHNKHDVTVTILFFTNESFSPLLPSCQLPARCEERLHLTGTGPINLQLIFFYKSSLDNGCRVKRQSTAIDGEFSSNFTSALHVSRRTAAEGTRALSRTVVHDFETSGRIIEQATETQFIEFGVKKCGNNKIRVNKIHSCLRHVITAGTTWNPLLGRQPEPQ